MKETLLSAEQAFGKGFEEVFGKRAVKWNDAVISSMVEITSTAVGGCLRTTTAVTRVVSIVLARGILIIPIDGMALFVSLVGLVSAQKSPRTQ